MEKRPVDSLLHYNYFLALESDVEQLSRYVDFAANEQTYSIEIARILMTASAEVDVLLKQLCKMVDSKSDASDIGGYYNVLSVALPEFMRFVVTIPRFGLSFEPWIDWSRGKPPSWWTANNKVKHHRYKFFDQASLKHALSAVAALFIAVLHFYRRQASEGLLFPTASLFSVPAGRKATVITGNHGVIRKYVWPGDKPIPDGTEILEVVDGKLTPVRQG